MLTKGLKKGWDFMSLTGYTATDKMLRGKISGADVLYIDAYQLAVQNGYKGTIDEWLQSFKGKDGITPHISSNGNWWIENTDTGVQAKGKDGITPHIGSNGNWWIENTDTGVHAQGEVALVRMAQVTLTASKWTGSDSLYSQVISIDGVTPYSKVDLLPSVEQLAVFHNKDVAFVTENDDGVVTAYAIGDKPTNDYTMQVSITEVTV